MNFDKYCLKELEELKRVIKRKINFKNEEIRRYMNTVLKKYLTRLDEDSSNRYIIHNIKFICFDMVDSQPEVVLLTQNIKLKIYTKTNKSFMCFKYYKNGEKKFYHFMNKKHPYSEKDPISFFLYDQLINFGGLLDHIGIRTLIVYLNDVEMKLIQHPILETRKNCIAFLLCCKHGNPPLYKDVAKLVAKKIWEQRYIK